MVDYVRDVPVLLHHLRSFMYGSAIPEEVATPLQTLSGVDADIIEQSAEILYANYDRLVEEGKRVCGELFNYAVEQRWAGFNQGDRSATIVQYIERDLGEAGAVKPPKPEEWPDPRAHLREGYDWRFEDGVHVAPEGEPEPIEQG